MLRCDIVKDDSGAYAAFTEQGWSVFQMTAAKIMDVIAETSLIDAGSSLHSVMSPTVSLTTGSLTTGSLATK